MTATFHWLREKHHGILTVGKCSPGGRHQPPLVWEVFGGHDGWWTPEQVAEDYDQLEAIAPPRLQ